MKEGKKCQISVTYTPSVLGNETASLNVNDNASNSPQTANLTGMGVPQVVLSPTSLVYAPQKVGTTSIAQKVTLANNLPTALAMGTITFTGVNSSDFASPTNTCGTSVPARGKCTISVTFKPGATGSSTSTMNVNDSANNSPQMVSLSGTGN